MSPLQWFAKLPGVSSAPPLRTVLRATRDRLSPPKQVPFQQSVTARQARLLAAGAAHPGQLCPMTVEDAPGQIPTIVVGGFVPGPRDATYLQRGIFGRHGSTYHIAFASGGFSAPLFEAQLGDLVEELSRHHRTPPVIFAVSYGAGLVIHWLRHLAELGRSPDLAGLILVSPVACTQDLIEPGAKKPATLLGRLVKGFLELPAKATEAQIGAWVDKSQQVMIRMFESGVQNKETLKLVLAKNEVLRLRQTVVDSIRATTPTGACERLASLEAMPSPLEFDHDSLPLSRAPALVLFAEKEDSIMIESSPTRRAFETRLRRYFPKGSFLVVTNPQGGAVQHASLLFHCFNFNPPISRFFTRLHTELTGVRKLRHSFARVVRPAHSAGRRKAEAAARAANERAGRIY
jgi:pimeloyl-ACP methyl ester carboxylesterase